MVLRKLFRMFVWSAPEAVQKHMPCTTAEVRGAAKWLLQVLLFPSTSNSESTLANDDSANLRVGEESKNMTIVMTGADHM